MTALQGGLVMTKNGSWNRETIFTDIIGLYSTTVTYFAISKAIEFGHLDEKREISRSRSFKVIDVGINRKPVCDFLLVINIDISRVVSELSRLIVQILDTLRF